MSNVSIAVVREFFEQNGFLVKVNRKYMPTKKKETQQTEIDIMVMNASPKGDGIQSFVITLRDIVNIPRAVVKIKGWHTESFGPSVLKASPKIFQFLSPDTVKRATQFFGTQEFLKLLVAPSLPATESVRKRSVEILKSKGVDGVIEFKTILEAMVGMVRVNRNYFESDILQLVRLFKVYDLLKGGQLELFGKRRRRKK